MTQKNYCFREQILTSFLLASLKMTSFALLGSRSLNKIFITTQIYSVEECEFLVLKVCGKTQRYPG